MSTSQGFLPGSWSGGLLGGALRIYGASLLGSIFGENKGFGEGTLVGLGLGETDVASLGISDGVRGEEELGMMSGKRWGRRVK